MASVQAATLVGAFAPVRPLHTSKGFGLAASPGLACGLACGWLWGFGWPTAGADTPTPTHPMATTQATARATLPKQPRIAVLTPATTRLPQPFRDTAPK